MLLARTWSNFISIVYLNQPNDSVMARVTLILPPEFIFNTLLSVRVSDINYGGHLGNDTVLSLAHEARFQFLRSLGYENETDLDEHIGLIVADAVVVYKAEAFYGDLIEVHLAAYDFNAYGLDFFYYLLNKDTGKEIARAKTGVVCVDYIKKKIAKAPEEFIRRIREPEGYTI